MRRRAFLRGVSGATMALPSLEAMAAPTEATATRMVCVGLNFGFVPRLFFPTTTGKDYELTERLEPLEKFRDDVTVFSGLDHGTEAQGGHGGVHAYLSGVLSKHSRNMPEANISVDQKAAQIVGSETRYPSLQIASGNDPNNQISWNASGVSLPPISKVDVLYSLLFQKVVIEEKQQEISDSINYAKRIQDAMMTSSVYLKDTLPKSFIFFKPKDVVSGDFYWIYKDHEENIFFTVADCTGHGVPGAFMSMIGTSLLNEIIIEKGIKDTDKVLYEMRAQIIKSLGQEEEGAQKDGMDISLCKLNMKNKTVEFSGAHNSLIHISGEELKTYRGDHQPVGLLLGDKKPFTKHKVKLKKDDMLYIYSDGYQDQFGGERGKKYMAAKFKNQLLKMSKETEDQQLSLLDQEFSSWIQDYEQIDDVCVMGVRII